MSTEIHDQMRKKDSRGWCQNDFDIIFLLLAAGSGPSRQLPQRPWAASIPTVLSHDAFNKLLSPVAPSMPGLASISPLEHFLGCVSLSRHMRRVVQSDDSVSTTKRDFTRISWYHNFEEIMLN